MSKNYNKKKTKKLSVDKAMKKVSEHRNIKSVYFMSNQTNIYNDLVRGKHLEDIVFDILCEWRRVGIIPESIPEQRLGVAISRTVIAVRNMTDILFGEESQLLLSLFSECDCGDCVGRFIINAVADLFESPMSKNIVKEYNNDLIAITNVVEILLILSVGFMEDKDNLTPVHQVWRLIEWFYA